MKIMTLDNLQNPAMTVFAAKSRNEVLKDVTASFVGSCCVIVEMMALVAMRGSKSVALCLHACCRTLPLGFMQVLQLLSPLAHYPCFFQLLMVLLLPYSLLFRYFGSWWNSHILKLMVTDSLLSPRATSATPFTLFTLLSTGYNAPQLPTSLLSWVSGQRRPWVWASGAKAVPPTLPSALGALGCALKLSRCWSREEICTDISCSLCLAQNQKAGGKKQPTK